MIGNKQFCSTIWLIRACVFFYMELFRVEGDSRISQMSNKYACVAMQVINNFWGGCYNHDSLPLGQIQPHLILFKNSMSIKSNANWSSTYL